MWVLTLTVVIGVIQIGGSTNIYMTQRDCLTAQVQAAITQRILERGGLRYQVRGKCEYQERA